MFIYNTFALFRKKLGSFLLFVFYDQQRPNESVSCLFVVKDEDHPEFYIMETIYYMNSMCFMWVKGINSMVT